ncbi:MAG: hypothetical protein ACE5DN_01035 [Flavobacteriales bacterium]
METLGVLFLILIMGMAFWVLTFLIVFIGGWICLGFIEKISPRLAYALIGHCEEKASGKNRQDTQS